MVRLSRTKLILLFSRSISTATFSGWRSILRVTVLSSAVCSLSTGLTAFSSAAGAAGRREGAIAQTRTAPAARVCQQAGTVRMRSTPIRGNGCGRTLYRVLLPSRVLLSYGVRKSRLPIRRSATIFQGRNRVQHLGRSLSQRHVVMASSISSRKWRLIVGTVLIVLVAGLVAGGYWLWRPSPCPRPDMTAVMHANNRGIGHMEQFKYDLAQSDFEEAVRLAPDCWMPGRINLGIALLNQKDPPFLARAIQAFDEVLKQEPDNPYAHYCLGVIAEYQGHLTKAVPEFEAVTRIDPNDAHAWMHLGACVGQLNFNDPSARAAGYLRTALRLNPNLNEARYRLAQDPNTSDAEKTTLLADKETLARAVWEDPSELIYSTMGRYADVIGRSADPSLKPAVGPLPLFRPSDSFHVTLAPGAHWAKADELGDGAVGDLRREARRRFGATMVLLDYNHDGKLDIFLVGAVVEKGKVRDLLLRNDGDGRFTDITTEAGLAGERTSLGCAVADYDNDGFPDLLITGAGAQKLFRNTG
ncbi:MAG TPA: hypothetical protein DDY78_18805, partial [Planctomycetales bacterium]|nr:hypothetical protein [Planctomycetales bacterium]